jgi:hypothetical protein
MVDATKKIRDSETGIVFWAVQAKKAGYVLTCTSPADYGAGEGCVVPK